MPAPLSIVIPCLNAADALPATADALLEGVTSGLVAELVLSDGGSDDGIAEMAEALGARLVSGTPGRGAQLRRGVAASSAPWLLLLHADTHLSPGWAEVAHRHMETDADRAGYFRLAFRAKGLAPALVARGANWRARAFGLPYGDQGLLISRHLLEDVGGVPDLPLMEDVALARALSGRLVALDSEAHTSAARYKRDGWARRVLSNLGTLARYRLGADPADLLARYERGKR